jgi:hypothetical protein
MRTLLRVLSGPLVIGLLLLLSLTVGAGATSSPARPLLPKSPISGSVLMARAIHSGQIKLTGPGAPAMPLKSGLLKNVQASGGGQPVNEDPIAANPDNPLDLLTGGNDYNCGSLQGFYATTDRGTNWTRTCMSVLSGNIGCGDPAVGYDLNNVLYIAGLDCGSPSVAVFEKSTNNGVTWSAPAVAVNATFSGGLVDKDWLQIDDSPGSPFRNNLYISATQFDPSSNSQISVSHSSNGGASWTTKVVDTVQFYPNVDQFSDLIIGADGTVYLSWMRCTANGSAGDCGGTTATFMLSRSTDGGNTWTTPAVITTATLVPDTCGAFYGCLPNTSERVSDIPAIGIDNVGGYLYVAFYTWTGTQMKVELTTSTDGGETWSKPVPVSPSTVTHDQFFPWIAVNSLTGHATVTWLDRRDDPSNIKYEAFGASSTNDGISVGGNVKLATAMSNPNNDGFGGFFMGDYTGAVYAGTTLEVSWMDSRNGVNMQDEVGGYALR